MDPLDLYLAEYQKHRAAGDDAMNARLRLIEQGATVQESFTVQALEGEDDEDGEEI